MGFSIKNIFNKNSYNHDEEYQALSEDDKIKVSSILEKLNTNYHEYIDQRENKYIKRAKDFFNILLKDVDEQRDLLSELQYITNNSKNPNKVSKLYPDYGKVFVEGNEGKVVSDENYEEYTSYLKFRINLVDCEIKFLYDEIEYIINRFKLDTIAFNIFSRKDKNKKKIIVIEAKKRLNKELIKLFGLLNSANKLINSLPSNSELSFKSSSKELTIQEINYFKHEYKKIVDIITDYEESSDIYIEKINTFTEGYYDFDKLIEKLAKYRSFMDRTIYKHRLDYIEIIKNIAKTIEKYIKTNSRDWNTTELVKEIESYDEIINKYLSSSKGYIDSDALTSIKDKLLSLCYFKYSLGSGETVELKSYTQEEQKNYYDIKSSKLLIDLSEKYLTKAQKFENNIRHKTIIDCLLKNKELHFLFDIINDDYSKLHLGIIDEKYEFTHEDSNICLYLKLGDFLEKLSEYRGVNQVVSADESRKVYITKENSIPMIDLYNIVKCLNVDLGYFYKLLRNKKYQSDKEGLSVELKDLIIKTWFNKYEKVYDNRIMIIPKALKIYVNEENFYAHRHSTGEMIDSLFVSTCDQMENVRNYYDEYKHISTIYLHQDVLDKFRRIDYFERIAYIHSPMGFDDIFEERAKERQERAEALCNNRTHVKVKVIGETKLYDLPKIIDKDQVKKSYRIF
jgi:hypothetical protein